MKSMLSSIFRHTPYFLLCGLLCCWQSALAERCEPLENNEYEKILCQLKKSGRGAALPNIYQFRENPPLTQALLLKKTAERAGITVKIPERDNQETLRRQEDLLMARNSDYSEKEALPLNSAVRTIEIIQQAKPVVVPAEPVQTPPVQPMPVEKAVEPVQVTEESQVEEKVVDADKVADLENSVATPSVVSAMSGCSLQQLTLQCANGRYQLVGNKTNQQLPDNALSEDHKLGLPVYSGASDDAAALESYLTKAYDRYLAGMMEIGLAASTMSYSKFAHLYHYIAEQHLDFAGRFETMYQFLKKDKAAIGVSTKLSLAEGLTPEYCNQLENFVVCDYQRVNYVFVKTGAPN